MPPPKGQLQILAQAVLLKVSELEICRLGRNLDQVSLGFEVCVGGGMVPDERERNLCLGWGLGAGSRKQHQELFICNGSSKDNTTQLPSCSVHWRLSVSITGFPESHRACSAAALRPT